MDRLIFGAAYYDEYMPCERLAQDIDMMKKAGINTIRIAESTWSTCEKQEGVFDFSHITRVLDAAEDAGISVIIGTPTYAVPTWLVRMHPDVLAETHSGQNRYGPRQNMDITNEHYLFYAERVIRRLMEVCAHRKCVIGYQLDNETKAYDTCTPCAQAKFVEYLREKFGDDLDALNAAYGLDYWSNRINAWEDFPDVRATINGSLGAEYERFQRLLVEQFLSWQADIVNEYRREDQFVTQNFDYEWCGWSCGMHPDVNQYRTARALTLVGTDIYHPGQEDLTGVQIAFGGDLMRSIKQSNYLVLETQAQCYPDRTPYPGQLRLAAYSHVASGACGVMYWHWHSIHNACESYWKGLLSHDFAPNETYLEACEIGYEFSQLGDRLAGLRKNNRTAVLVSNDSLTALKWFGIDETCQGKGDCTYNKVIYWIYDCLYRMNVECDFLFPESENFSDYDTIIVPALYSAEDSLLERLRDWTAEGGNLICTFKTAFADENCKISHEIAPRILGEYLGVHYHQFTLPRDVSLEGSILRERGSARTFMELLIPHRDTEVLAHYVHPAWGKYAAVTRRAYEKGCACYIGCMTDEQTLCDILREVLHLPDDEAVPQHHDGLIIRRAVNPRGEQLTFLLNYSWQEREFQFKGERAQLLLCDGAEFVTDGECIIIEPWDVCILAE